MFVKFNLGHHKLNKFVIININQIVCYEHFGEWEGTPITKIVLSVSDGEHYLWYPVTHSLDEVTRMIVSAMVGRGV